MPFADELLGAPALTALIDALSEAAPGNPLTALRAVELGELPLRERSDLIRDALLTDLPGGYDAFAATIRAAQDGERPFTGWLIWPVTTAVVARALADDAAFDDGLALLAELTPRLTSEFAIRGLLAHDLDRALPIVLSWTTSPDEHVRRLATEGTRPFLPWTKRVPAILARPRATLPILSALYRDESEYVRRSVANHLNDLSREHPDLVVETAAAWLSAPDANTERVVRHGLRTLVKKGHPGALALLGFTTGAVLDVVGPTLAEVEIPFGGSVRFTATVTNTASAPAVIAVDYIVHHRKANGRLAGKTFKLTTATLAPGERRQISREHSFRPITTRRYYPGVHAIELQLNGVAAGRSEFTLNAGPPG
ncbi:DNA alkylation repair protein [Cryptosporangium aurantiacum]|uniref:3-methyladenine DNA glycosylase AlkC n=1 Tax=Cryptosporangium aurantiacum TaxID=134849 RepID=A0A1M7QR68_9ACTN|nr:DNA alkylation repair protein [Cryptosporangium aurantiacum]SHN33875.1 3-methyladenine DNA glycosylase AlkC [Cryptosporangium aurantiacum]